MKRSTQTGLCTNGSTADAGDNKAARQSRNISLEIIEAHGQDEENEASDGGGDDDDDDDDDTDKTWEAKEDRPSPIAIGIAVSR
ncbi:hypothetical protein XA68_15204 [Ophiocordyceps unilateralis]|uniref:Uncharacterized protein n=1 Tax=Ophiocordyceps unilateralis TaxID=268505 RepID=A0A2A9P8W0_OPHUN|nr:hypothetical protein XA68_15204 [Ophiocordyceps unilateralis]